MSGSAIDMKENRVLEMLFFRIKHGKTGLKLLKSLLLK